MTKEKRIEMIEEAMKLIRQAQELVDDAVKGTDCKPSYDAYGKYGFDTLLNNGNPYDEGLQNIIDELNNEEED